MESVERQMGSAEQEIAEGNERIHHAAVTLHEAPRRVLGRLARIAMTFLIFALILAGLRFTVRAFRGRRRSLANVLG